MIAVQHNVNFTNMYKSDEYNMRSKKHVILVDKAVLEEFVSAVELDDELMTNEFIIEKVVEWKEKINSNKCDIPVSFVQTSNYMPHGLINKYEYKIQRLELNKFQTDDDETRLFLGACMMLTRITEKKNLKEASESKKEKRKLSSKDAAGTSADAVTAIPAAGASGAPIKKRKI